MNSYFLPFHVLFHFLFPYSLLDNPRNYRRVESPGNLAVAGSSLDTPWRCVRGCYNASKWRFYSNLCCYLSFVRRVDLTVVLRCWFSNLYGRSNHLFQLSVFPFPP